MGLFGGLFGGNRHGKTAHFTDAQREQAKALQDECKRNLQDQDAYDRARTPWWYTHIREPGPPLNWQAQQDFMMQFQRDKPKPDIDSMKRAEPVKQKRIEG